MTDAEQTIEQQAQQLKALRDFNVSLDAIQESFLAMSKALTDEMLKLEAEIAKAIGLSNEDAARAITGRIAEKWADRIVDWMKH